MKEKSESNEKAQVGSDVLFLKTRMREEISKRMNKTTLCCIVPSDYHVFILYYSTKKNQREMENCKHYQTNVNA